MERTRRSGSRRRLGVALGIGLSALAGLLAPRTAAAQTWVGMRTTPRLTEAVAIDATGEQSWLYGAEDVLGDGLETFMQQEQSIDVRTAYATVDAQRFWARVYVSDPNGVGGNVSVYVFIDADRSTMTGGSAQATDIDPRFVTDSSPGGYEYVIGIRGNASISQIWTWTMPQGTWVGSSPQPNQAAAEAGQDIDPILLNEPQHGYLQATVDLGLVGLTFTCDANLYFRSASDNAMLGEGDLDVGVVAPCVPADANGDDIPDIVVPPSGCTTDAECPNGGICQEGGCVLAVPCVTDADCQADEQCTMDGRCVPRPTGVMCTTNAECGDLVCVGGECVACTPGGSECDAGQVCAPTGHCVVDTGPGSGTGGGGTGGAGGDGLGLEPGEEIRGGACACRTAPMSAGGGASVALAAGGLGLALRRRRRSPRPAR